MSAAPDAAHADAPRVEERTSGLSAHPLAPLVSASDATARWLADTVDTFLEIAVAEPLDRLAQVNEERALRDPVYAHLRNTMADRESGMSWDEFTVKMNVYDQVALHPWWEAPLRSLGDRPALRAYRSVRHAWQRVTRGWDDRATWSLDTHLSRTLGAQLLHLADTTHGWPGEPEFQTADEWLDALRLHGNALIAYGNRWGLEDDLPPDEALAVIDEVTAQAQESLRWVADHLPNLWD